jgi:hypothetical protein
VKAVKAWQRAAGIDEGPFRPAQPAVAPPKKCATCRDRRMDALQAHVRNADLLRDIMIMCGRAAVERRPACSVRAPHFELARRVVIAPCRRHTETPRDVPAEISSDREGATDPVGVTCRYRGQKMPGNPPRVRHRYKIDGAASPPLGLPWIPETLRILYSDNSLGVSP